MQNVRSETLFERNYRSVSHDGKYKIIAKFQLHRIGDQSPYFSITADTYRKARNNHWQDESGGCLHYEIAKHFPNLRKYIPLHLSNMDGVPMHACENAYYFAGGCNREWYMRDKPVTDANHLANHLRISTSQARDLIMRVRNGMNRKYFDMFCDAQRDRWKREANQAIRYLQFGRYTHP